MTFQWSSAVQTVCAYCQSVIVRHDVALQALGRVKTALQLRDADSGDDFVVAPNERTAKSVASTREHWQRDARRGRPGPRAGAGSLLVP